ncbi:dihydroorotate dehydrogenase electron transfer subunit [Candidatus Bathyarchaeota archaeon]|nr:dihydroorotate dehydrogenase electron transfer subunit [Candidatus Bathyarchaeota archaeon]
MKENTRNVEIARVDYECKDIWSLLFQDDEIRKAKPGQYIMVWMPGIDEIPMSISAKDVNGLSRITVRVIGHATNSLTSMKEGERIGVRGPFGNSYGRDSRNPLVVAGGSGMASLMPLLEDFLVNNVKPTVVLGARSADQLLFVNQLEQLLGEDLLITTDDGSRGFTGYASGYAAKLMETRKFDMVYTCGPEIMMSKVFYAAEENGLPLQASLERYIKCAVGLCGACVIGPYRVCKDGPIFNSSMLRETREEFGVSKMDPSGRRIRVDH